MVSSMGCLDNYSSFKNTQETATGSMSHAPSPLPEPFWEEVKEAYFTTATFVATFSSLSTPIPGWYGPGSRPQTYLPLHYTEEKLRPEEFASLV